MCLDALAQTKSDVQCTKETPCFHGTFLSPIAQGTEFYFATTVGDNVATIANIDELEAFFGDIDTAAEALWWIAIAHRQTWGGTIETSAIRQVEGGFEVVGYEWVSDCDPVQRDRVLWFIGNDGSLVELDRSVLELRDGVCT